MSSEKDKQRGMTGESTGSSEMFSLSGKTLNKYRLLEKLGQGGMAQVYKAYQPELDRYVAVKVLHPHLTGDEDFAARFRREARAIAALEHPHIVRVYDFDADQGLAFLVMEHLGGRGLRSLLRDLDCRDELMDLEEVGRIVGALADALDYAHQRGTVHRDVKPSNVIITADGRPVLTDFGIARMIDVTAVTESGGTLGTPAYMSPEQGRGESGDARSDIYSLGVLLYQLCTGRVPFDADTPYAIILKHITAPLPSPRSLRPDLPEAVERVILKALTKDPDDRYQKASEIGRALHDALYAAVRAGESFGASSAAPSRRPGVLGRVSGAIGKSVRIMGSSTRRSKVLQGLILIAVTGLACVLGLFITRPFRIQRYLDRLTPTPAVAETVSPGMAAEPTEPVSMLAISGPDVAEDTWLNPDLPDDVWHEFDLVHLQGPLTPDRLLFHFDLSGLPEGATVVSATLVVRVELWGDQSLPGAAVAYRVLTPWEPETANYNAPWSTPGLAGGVDYDSVPLDIVPVPDEGLLVMDVSRALMFWWQGEPNYGVVVMMSGDSHNMTHHWVYMGEQPDPADRPTLYVAYEVSP